MATDKLFHMLSTRYPGSILKWLGVKDYGHFKASSYTVKALERRMDIVFENEVGEDKAIYVEFHCYEDEMIFFNMAIKMLQYGIEKKFYGEFQPVVVFDSQYYYQKSQDVNYHYATEQRLCFKPVVIVMEKFKWEDLAATGDIHLVPLYPLCGISETEIKQRTPDWVQRIKDEAIDKLEQAQLLTLLGGFIAHRLGEIGLGMLNNLLGDFKMEETQVGKDLINIGHLQGWQEGKTEGKKEGKKEEALQIIMILLEQRFGQFPVENLKKIRRIRNLEKLHQIIKNLLDGTDMSKLQNMLN